MTFKLTNLKHIEENKEEFLIMKDNRNKYFERIALKKEILLINFKELDYPQLVVHCNFNDDSPIVILQPTKVHHGMVIYFDPEDYTGILKTNDKGYYSIYVHSVEQFKRELFKYYTETTTI